MKLLTILTATSLLLLAACATQEKAPIVMGSGSSRDNFAPTPAYQAATGKVERYKIHEVLYTDTVASLAKRYNVSPHDIISLNNLPKPYSLEPGEVVKIPLYENTPQGGYLKLPGETETAPQPLDSKNLEPNKNTVKILPSLPSEQLQDYDY